MATFTETFTQADGALAGWTSTGGTNLVVVGNQGSSNNNTANYTGTHAHGLTLTGDWQIDFDVVAPLTIGHGGVTVSLLSGVGNGYGIFAGNATHVQKLVGGSPTNLTNDTRPAAAGHITMTHTAAGLFSTYQDGVLQGTITDTSSSAGANVFLSIQTTESPSPECTIDNLVVADSITGTTAAAATPPPHVYGQAVHRASRW